MRFRILRREWSPPSLGRPVDTAALVNRMDRVLSLWAGTPYGSGQRCRGAAADCIGFVFGAIDDVDGRPRAQAPSMPPDSALHDPDASAAALAALRALYEPVEPVPSGAPVEPFDILVVGPRLAGPSHAMLVGTSAGHLWHCTPHAGVHRGGWALGPGYESLRGAFRIGDRRRWLR